MAERLLLQCGGTVPPCFLLSRARVDLDIDAPWLAVSPPSLVPPDATQIPQYFRLVSSSLDACAISSRTLFESTGCRLGVVGTAVEGLDRNQLGKIPVEIDATHRP